MIWHVNIWITNLDVLHTRSDLFCLPDRPFLGGPSGFRVQSLHPQLRWWSGWRVHRSHRETERSGPGPLQRHRVLKAPGWKTRTQNVHVKTSWESVPFSSSFWFLGLLTNKPFHLTCDSWRSTRRKFSAFRSFTAPVLSFTRHREESWTKDSSCGSQAFFLFLALSLSLIRSNKAPLKLFFFQLIDLTSHAMCDIVFENCNH